MNRYKHRGVYGARRASLRSRLTKWLWYWWLRFTPRTRCASCGSDDVLVGLATMAAYGTTTTATWKQARYYCNACGQKWFVVGDRRGPRQERPRESQA